MIEESIKKMQTAIPAKGNIDVLYKPDMKGSYTSAYKGIVDPSYLDFVEKYKLLE